MLLDTIFAPFVTERPICVMARGILERLLDAPRIDALFARTAQQQYTRELLFSSLVQLMSEVVLGVHPTVHAAYQANKAAIGVSTTALYNKLDRVEPGVSAALVRDSAALAEPMVKALRASQPRWLPGYQIKVLDGNHLSSTEHRLKALRGTWAAPLPGQALVVLDQQRMLITDVVLSEDGHAQERSLIDQVLQHVEADQLWIEDRNFCTLALMFGMARRGATFVVRQHGQLQGELLGRAKRTGTTRSGPVYEQAMLVRDPNSGETMQVRRMTIQLKVPTRDGDTGAPHPLQCPGRTGLCRATGPALRQAVEHRDRLFRDHHNAVVRDQYIGLSQGRVVYLLPGVVGIQRGVAHQSCPAERTMAARRSMTRSRAIICPWKSAAPTTA